MIRLLFSASIMTAICLISGCSGPTGPQTGVVRFDDGTPVTSGSIEFRRKSDQETFSSRISASGAINPMSTDGDPGLPPGAYDVVVVQIVMTEDLAKHAHTHGGTVPRDYADYNSSDLTCTVNEGQVNPVEIVVPLDEPSAS